MPRFSIVVPSYNAEDTLAQTLDAILAQSYDDWECVVVDDGSHDGTRALAETYATRDSRFRVISQENRGSAGAYNTGVSAANGEFIVLCSADDILLAEHLMTMAEFIEREPDYDIYSSNGYFWRAEEDSRRLVYPEGVRDEVGSLSLSDVISLCFYSVGAVYRREWFEEVGGYREGIFGEDYDFWLRIMAAGAQHRYTPAALSLHRLSVTQKSANLKKSYESDIAILQNLRAISDLSSDEVAAVEATVRQRKRLIEGKPDVDLNEEMRRGFVTASRRLIGEDGTRRLTSWLKSKRRTS